MIILLLLFTNSLTIEKIDQERTRRQKLLEPQRLLPGSGPHLKTPWMYYSTPSMYRTMDMLGVSTDILSVHVYKSCEDTIYVFITLLAHSPCTHGSHHAGAEYFGVVDCSTVVRFRSSSTSSGAVQQEQQDTIRND
jgi:hypothetical protein